MLDRTQRIDASLCFRSPANRLARQPLPELTARSLTDHAQLSGAVRTDRGFVSRALSFLWCQLGGKPKPTPDQAISLLEPHRLRQNKSTPKFELAEGFSLSFQLCDSLLRLYRHNGQYYVRKQGEPPRLLSASDSYHIVLDEAHRADYLTIDIRDGEAWFTDHSRDGSLISGKPTVYCPPDASGQLFDRLFPGGAARRVRQGKVGNCYQISDVFGLKYLDDWSMLLRAIVQLSVHRVPHNGKTGWQITFIKGELIFVGDEEIEKLGRQLIPEGDPGDRLFAVAYSRFRKERTEEHRGMPTLLAAEGGHRGEFIEALTGWPAEKATNPAGSLVADRVQELAASRLLDLKRSGRAKLNSSHVVSAAALPWPGRTAYQGPEGQDYADPQCKILLSHAYTVLKYNGKTVTLLNPHDSHRPIVLTRRETLEIFSSLTAVHLPEPLNLEVNLA